MKKQDRIFEELERRILHGEWPVGSRIPTEAELATTFRCSRTTVSKALAQMAQVGLVERRARAGTTVLRNSPRPTLPALDLNACAFIYPTESHEGIWRTTMGFQQAAGAAQVRALMLSTGTDTRKEAEILGHLGEFAIQGAVLLPVILDPEDYGYYTRMILACRYPIVLVELNLPGLRRPAVVPDGFHAGYTMTRHLLSQGRTRIGFVSNFAWTPLARDKYLGYRQALAEAGIGERAEWVRQEQRMTPRYDDPTQEPTALAAEYLATRPAIEAVVCSSDFLALGMVRAAGQRGLKVPDDLAVTGIDDYTMGRDDTVSLTTYHVPYEEIGKRAFALLQELLGGTDHGAQEVLVQGWLVSRQSA